MPRSIRELGDHAMPIPIIAGHRLDPQIADRDKIRKAGEDRSPPQSPRQIVSKVQRKWPVKWGFIEVADETLRTAGLRGGGRSLVRTRLWWLAAGNREFTGNSCHLRPCFGGSTANSIRKFNSLRWNSLRIRTAHGFAQNRVSVGLDQGIMFWLQRTVRGRTLFACY